MLRLNRSFADAMAKKSSKRKMGRDGMCVNVETDYPKTAAIVTGTSTIGKIGRSVRESSHRENHN